MLKSEIISGQKIDAGEFLSATTTVEDLIWITLARIQEFWEDYGVEEVGVKDPHDLTQITFVREATELIILEGDSLARVLAHSMTDDSELSQDIEQELDVLVSRVVSHMKLGLSPIEISEDDLDGLREILERLSELPSNEYTRDIIQAHGDGSFVPDQLWLELQEQEIDRRTSQFEAQWKSDPSNPYPFARNRVQLMIGLHPMFAEILETFLSQKDQFDNQEFRAYLSSIPRILKGGVWGDVHMAFALDLCEKGQGPREHFTWQEYYDLFEGCIQTCIRTGGGLVRPDRLASVA